MGKAMIVAAGLGTRLKPLTDNMPKALVEVAGKPLLRRVIEKLASAGYDDIVVNVHHFADMIEEYLIREGLMDVTSPVGGGPDIADAAVGDSREGDSAQGAGKWPDGIRVRVSDERDLLRDTGGGIRHAAPLLKGALPGVAQPVSGDLQPTSGNAQPERFLVHNVDILSNLDLSLMEKEFPSDALAMLAVSDRKTSRYLLFDDDMRLVGWTNVSTGEVRSPWPYLDPEDCYKFAFSGIQMISTEIFDIFEEEGMGEKFSIIDFYLRIARKYPICGLVCQDLKLVDVGKIEVLEKLRDTPELII